MYRKLTGLVATALVAATAPLDAQDTEWNRYTLEDLAGVYVRAEANPACQSAGVEAAGIKAMAEEALTAAEVAVLTEAAMLEAPGLPELRISLTCAPAEVGSADVVGYAVSVRVQQAAQMIRDPQITLPEAITWFADTVGVAAADAVPGAVSSAVGVEIQAFADAFVAANAVDEETGASN